MKHDVLIDSGINIVFTLVTSKSCKLDPCLIKTHLIQQSVNVGSTPTQHFMFNLCTLPFDNSSIHLMEMFVFKKMKCSSSVKCTVAENLWKCMRISWNFHRGGGRGLKKISSMGEVWVFSETAHSLLWAANYGSSCSIT